jgi:alpha-tubulin suppressor-like RCC1 family protein
MIDVYDKKDKRRKILSAGKSRFGVLGLGESIKETNLYKEIKFDYSKVQIAHIELSVRHAFAITTTGELYAWGTNDQLALGLPVETNHVQNVPKKVECLSEYAVKKVACGDLHNLVYAKVLKNGK